MNLSIEHLTSDLFEELRPLGQESWDECSEVKKDTCSFHGERGFTIQPDKDQYLFHAERDSLLAFIIRDENGSVQGYSLAILYQSLHHAPVTCANVDTFYIRPNARIYIRSFIAMMERKFEECGVVVVGWPVTPKGGLFDVLQKLGYAPDDVVMEKRICALQQQ